MPQLPQFRELQLEQRAAATLESLHTWAAAATDSVHHQAQQLQQHRVADLWQQLLSTVNQLQGVAAEVTQQGRDAARSTVQLARTGISTAVDQVTSAGKQLLDRQSPSSQTQSSQAVSHSQGLEHAAATVQKYVGAAAERLRGINLTVPARLKDMRVSVPELHFPAVNVSQLRTRVTPTTGAMAVAALVAAAALWQGVGHVAKGKRQEEDAVEAAAKAQAKRSLDRQRDRLKKALVIDEAFREQGSIDSSAFAALAKRNGAAADKSGGNPFLASGESDAIKSAWREGNGTLLLAVDSYLQYTPPP